MNGRQLRLVMASMRPRATVRGNQCVELNTRFLVSGSPRSQHCFRSANVATCGYNSNVETGIRELRDNLSRYLRRIEAGERVMVTVHGRVVAELVPPGLVRPSHSSEFDRLVASGVITPPSEEGDPLEDCPEIRLAPGTATALIDSDRDER